MYSRKISVFYLPPYFQSTQHSCAPQPKRKLKAVRYLDVPNDSKIFPGDNLLAARLSEPKRFHNTDQSEWARPIWHLPRHSLRRMVDINYV